MVNGAGVQIFRFGLKTWRGNHRHVPKSEDEDLDSSRVPKSEDLDSSYVPKSEDLDSSRYVYYTRKFMLQYLQVLKGENLATTKELSNYCGQPVRKRTIVSGHLWSCDQWTALELQGRIREVWTNLSATQQSNLQSTDEE